MRVIATVLVSLALNAGVAADARTSPAAQVQAAASEAAPLPITASVSNNTTGIPEPGVARLYQGGGFGSGNVTLRRLIEFSYRRHFLDHRVIEGGPAWIDTARFNVTFSAKTNHVLDADGVPRRTWATLQALLLDRFKLQVRTEIREVPIYALVLASGDGLPGPHLRRSDLDCAAAVATMLEGRRPEANCGFQEHVGRYVPSVLTMPDMAAVFSALVDRPVVDRTGLAGHFAAAIEGIEVRPPGPFDAGYRPSDVKRAMFTALPAELGLRLEATTGRVEVLVIESAADPTLPAITPLFVERTDVVPADPVNDDLAHLSVALHNRGDRTIVAWGIRTEVSFADDQPLAGGMSTDGVEYPAFAPGATIMLPGARRTIRAAILPANRMASGVRSVTAETTFVIFDDDTALGNERDISFIFERRARNHRAWPLIETIVNAARAAHPDPREAVLAIEAGLDEIAGADVRQSDAWTSIRHLLRMNSRSRDFARLLATTVEQVGARRALAAAHFQRRK